MSTPRQLLRTAVSASGLTSAQLLELLQLSGVLVGTSKNFFKNMLTPNHPSAKLDVNLCPLIQKQCGLHHAFFGCAQSLGYSVEPIAEKDDWKPIANRFVEIEKAKAKFLQAAEDKASPEQLLEAGNEIKAAIDRFMIQYRDEILDGSRIRLQSGDNLNVNHERIKKKKKFWNLW